MNEAVAKARLRKSTTLAAEIEELSTLQSVALAHALETVSDEWWERMADIAGVCHPSDKTKEMVIEIIRRG